MIPAHHQGAADQDLPVVGDLDLGADDRHAHDPEHRMLGAPDARPAAGLGQCITLDHDQASRMEPGGDVLRQCRAARDQEADSPAQAGSHLRQRQPVGQRMLDLHDPTRPPSLDLGLRDPTAHREGPGEQPQLDPALFLDGLNDLCVHLLEDPRRTGHERRPEYGQVLNDLVHPAVDRRGKPDLQLHRRKHLAERVRQRQPQVLQVVAAQDPHGLGPGTDIGPAPMGQLHTLRTAGGPRRVDQRGQMLWPDGDHGLINRRRAVNEVLGAQCLQIVQAQHPLAVRMPVERDDTDHVGQVITLGAQLGDLDVVLGEDDPGAAVGQDVGDILAPRRGIDSGRRRTRAHDREVGVEPFDARGGGDRDPLLRLDPQSQQASSHRLDRLGCLRPGDRGPSGVGREPERLAVWGRRDPVIEHPGHRQRGRRIAAGVGGPGSREGHGPAPPLRATDPPSHSQAP